MKVIYTSAVVLFAVFATAFTCANSSSNKKIISENPKANGFAVVELFTSEGCSSCPPADATVANLLKENNSNVYVLGYHVDYWNNLGWKDVFSSASYTQRQRNYARAFKLTSVYTPQVVVNGEEQFVGSDGNKLRNTVNKDLNENSTEQLVINAENKSGRTVNVSIKINDKSNDNLNIALVQAAAQSQVKRGENSGALLHHVNVVRDFKTVAANADQNITLQIPDNLSAKDCFVIAFTQDAGNMKILSASKANITQ